MGARREKVAVVLVEAGVMWQLEHTKAKVRIKRKGLPRQALDKQLKVSRILRDRCSRLTYKRKNTQMVQKITHHLKGRTLS